MKNEPKLQPATREKTCQVCGAVYVYPEKGSRATRFHCETCVALPAGFLKVLTRLNRRIQTLEKNLKT